MRFRKEQSHHNKSPRSAHSNLDHRDTLRQSKYIVLTNRIQQKEKQKKKQIKLADSKSSALEAQYELRRRKQVFYDSVRDDKVQR